MIDELIHTGQQMGQAGLIRGSGGNLSFRDGASIVISRSGVDLARLGPADFVAVDPARDLTSQQALWPRPSSELSMHLAAYRARPQCQVVIHAHPPHCISLGLVGRSLPAISPDYYLHLGPIVPLLGYLTPTTVELAEAVATALARGPAVLLQNHGALVTGRSAAEALLRLVLLEEHTAIYLRALAAGEPRLLSAEDMARLDEVTGGRYQHK
jgi:L-fuculose-phosphate aldolase